jgi:hypothetical protein
VNSAPALPKRPCHFSNYISASTDRQVGIEEFQIYSQSGVCKVL